MPSSRVVPRSIAPLVLRAAETFPAIGLVGPRQSGKSILARTLFPRHRVAILESPDVRRAALEDPRGFLDGFRDFEGAVLDEIQRAPELLSYLLEYVDRDLQHGRRMGRWILTGSESLLLSERVGQSLAGRIAMLEVLPMDARELAQFPRKRAMGRPSLTRAVVEGGYPALKSEHPDRPTWFDAYLATYVERDVRNILRVGDLSTFRRFLGLCAGRTAQLLNLSQLGADAGVSQSTARAWMSLLEATYVVRLVPGWHGSLGKRLVKAPKLHFIDTGLACALLGIADESQLALHPLRGALVESWVAGELMKAQAAHGLRGRLFHWRDQNAAEADLVIDFGGRLTVIEVKSATTVLPDWARALRRMTDALPAGTPFEQVIVHGGDGEVPPLRGTTLVPWSQTAEFATRVFGEAPQGGSTSSMRAEDQRKATAAKPKTRHRRTSSRASRPRTRR